MEVSVQAMFGFRKPVYLVFASLFCLILYIGILTLQSETSGFRNNSNDNSLVLSQSLSLSVLPPATEPPVETFLTCQSSFQGNSALLSDDLPKIYFITPTYSRPVQMPELIRLGQTLLHVPVLHWIVVEDANTCNKDLTQFLLRLGLPFTHLASAMPTKFRKEHIVPRGVSNRRAALHWIREHINDGVIYFGDDDNTFDLRLFAEIRDTRKVSMFPVGLVGEYAVSSPIVDQGQVIGFFDSWPAKRKFAIDMAGFAVSVKYLLQHANATIPYKAGYEEDLFLQALNLQTSDIEPKAKNCTEILVWHTRTVQINHARYQPPKARCSWGENLEHLLKSAHKMGLATVSKTGKESLVTLLRDPGTGNGEIETTTSGCQP